MVKGFLPLFLIAAYLVYGLPAGQGFSVTGGTGAQGNSRHGAGEFMKKKRFRQIRLPFLLPGISALPKGMPTWDITIGMGMIFPSASRRN